MPAPSRVTLSLSFALALSLAGCNEGKSVGGHDADPGAPDAYAVRGSVTYKDQPVEGEATFTRTDGPDQPVTAKITNGSYELTAPQGKYRVTITGKAGDADLPADLSAERAVGPDTGGNTVNINLPQADAEQHEGSTPEEVRQGGISEHPEK